MKKTILILILAFSILLTAVTANAVSVVEFDGYPNFKFAVESDGTNTFYAVYKYEGTDTEVKIPEMVNNNIVKHIYEKAFYNNDLIQKVVLNNNVTQIQNWGFRGCDNLEYVYCPPSLAVVWKYAFGYNNKIQSILLKNTSVEHFYAGVFANDTSLKYVSLPDTTKTIGSICFSNTALEYINIPYGTETIEYSAFENIESLKFVYIPSTVTAMGENVFKNSPNVTVYCVENSAAHKYCIENNIDYNIIGEKEYPNDMIGDVDNNGYISIRDVTSIQMELAKLETKVFITDNCDANRDCSLTISDATVIQKYLAKQINAF